MIKGGGPSSRLARVPLVMLQRVSFAVHHLGCYEYSTSYRAYILVGCQMHRATAKCDQRRVQGEQLI